ncbi:hypothetical protein V2J09_009206 [Rumex salicifolius]
MYRLEGKIAVITGAGSGFGKAAAAAFIRNGAKVVIADMNREIGEEAEAELGEGASFVLCDVTKESEVSNVVDRAVEMHGQVDIMYNNAGVPCRTPPSIVDLDLSTFDRTLAINLRGTVAGMKHAARVMIPRQKGCILCTASVTAVLGGMAQHTYSVSKSAVAGLVKSASAELSRHGIRVNCISPFAVPTAFVMDELRAAYPGLDDVSIRKMLRATGALKGAHCEEADVANAALYLASDEAKYVSGHNLVVDGGFTAFKTLSLPLPAQIQ